MKTGRAPASPSLLPSSPSSASAAAPLLLPDAAAVAAAPLEKHMLFCSLLLFKMQPVVSLLSRIVKVDFAVHAKFYESIIVAEAL